MSPACRVLRFLKICMSACPCHVPCPCPCLIDLNMLESVRRVLVSNTDMHLPRSVLA